MAIPSPIESITGLVSDLGHTRTYGGTGTLTVDGNGLIAGFNNSAYVNFAISSNPASPLTVCVDLDVNFNGQNTLIARSEDGGGGFNIQLVNSSGRSVVLNIPFVGTYTLGNLTGTGIHRLGASLTTTSGQLYLDGVAFGSPVTIGSIGSKTSGFYTVGAWLGGGDSPNSTSTTGAVAGNHRVYPAALNATDMLAEYNTYLAGGLQLISPNLFTNTNSFFIPTVSRGAATLSPSLVTNTNGFYSHTLTNVYRLTAALFTNSQIFYSATVGRGAVNLTPSLYSNSNAFFASTVSNGAIQLQPSLLSNANTIYSASVTYRNTLTPALITNTSTFYSATVASLYSVNPALYTNSQSFYPANVTAGSVQLSPSIFSNNNQFYSPNVQIAGGVQYVSPNLFVNGPAFFNASLSKTVTLNASLFNNANLFNVATVNSRYEVSAQLLINSQVFFTHNVKFNQSLTAGLYLNSNSFYVPYVGVGKRLQYPLSAFNQDYPLAGFTQTYPLEGN